MAGIDWALIAGIASAVGAATTAGTQIHGAVQRANAPKPQLPQAPDMAQIAKALLPGVRADTASRLGGGISTSYLSDELGRQMGTPVDLGILDEIRQSLGQQGP